MRRILPFALLLVLLPFAPVQAKERSFAQARAAMLKGLRSSDAADRSAAVFELDGFDSAEAARLLVRQVLTRDDRARVIRAGLQLAGSLKTKEAIAVLVEESAKGGWLKRSRVLDALGFVKAEEALAASLVAAYDKDPKVRTSALLSLEHRKDGRATMAATDALKAKEWPVRSAAIYVLEQLQDRSAAPDLIRRLSGNGEDGRLLDEVSRALSKLTNRPPSADFERWAEWYREKVAGEDVDLGPARPAPVPRAFLGGTATFARRLVFVLGISDTMNQKFVYDPGKIAPPDVRRQGKAALRPWLAVKTKLDLARLWIAWGIDHLSADVEFNVITYGASADAVFSDFVRATRENREKAKKRVLALSASGNANIYDGLKKIFTLHSRDPYDDENLLRGPECVFFLSDGAGDEGEIKEPYRAFEEVEQWNRIRQIRFNCFGVGDFDPRVLADLAGMVPGGSMESLP